jgi:hypothetical protein
MDGRERGRNGRLNIEGRMRIRPLRAQHVLVSRGRHAHGAAVSAFSKMLETAFSKMAHRHMAVMRWPLLIALKFIGVGVCMVRVKSHPQNSPSSPDMGNKLTRTSQVQN